MKKVLISATVFISVIVLSETASAQGGYGRVGRNVSRADTTRKKDSAQINNTKNLVKPPATTPVTTTNPSAVGAATIRYDTTGEGFNSKPQISLRNNYAVERTMVKDRKPLEYEHLREDDHVWSEFLWREIDAREKINQSFMYPGKDQNGEDQRFFSILLQAIRNDSVTAFSPDDDRFTTPLSLDKIMDMTAGKNDTVIVPDPLTGVEEKIITKAPRFQPDSVYTFRIKEQVIFDKESSRLFTRIIGIAPIAKITIKIGDKKVSSPSMLFWVYYPDIRKTLAKTDVYNPRNFSSRMTWEELFESRYFSSYLIKSSANNPGDRYLSAMIKDPLFRLLEGENIKTRIFNWEQDLWQH